ncbi:Signal transduction histidine kinase [Anopheles sinensis]|uniref:Signal transduction histidine kinase n=1 Tax=Anopheles sinensis TaxID=74873 RepID=A0A084VAF8_ANOSI|nr:Signal transduction histidine kinase [Anopheles sinensis]
MRLGMLTIFDGTPPIVILRAGGVDMFSQVGLEKLHSKVECRSDGSLCAVKFVCAPEISLQLLEGGVVHLSPRASSTVGHKTKATYTLARVIMSSRKSLVDDYRHYQPCRYTKIRCKTSPMELAIFIYLSARRPRSPREVEKAHFGDRRSTFTNDESIINK